MARLQAALIFFVGLVVLEAVAVDHDPDESYDLDHLVQSRGYILQSHDVTTADGYILTIHRVVPKSFTNDTEYLKGRKPIIANHGLTGSSSNFLMTSHELHPFNATKCGDNFGYCIVDTGRYDLWLTNNRGNGYSMKHVNMTKDSPGFWHFSWDHLAKYDLPAVIDLVRNKTGHKTVGYIGHSQGCAIMLALLSSRPEYADIVQPAILWSPAAYVAHMKSLIKIAIPFMDYYQKLGSELNLTGLMNMFTGDGHNSCRVGESEDACYKFLVQFAGPTTHVDHKRVIVYMHHFPAPVSMWQVVHFGQNYLSKTFSHFDYKNTTQNLAVYGTEHAPEYVLRNISPKAKIVVAWGSTDYLVDPVDVQHLLSILKPVLKENLIEYHVPSEQFNHLDFVIGVDAGKLLYDQTINWLDQYTK